MLFQTTQAHEELRAKVRAFAEEEIKPIAFMLDQQNEFPDEAIRKLGEMGLMGIPFPAEYGGAGLDALSYAIAVEELARVEGEIQRLQAVPQAPTPDSLAEAARSHREAAARQSQLGTLAVQRAQLTELLTQAETILAERAIRARGIAQARKAAYRAGASRRLRRPVSLVEGPLPQQWLPLHRREDTEKGVL